MEALKPDVEKWLDESEKAWGWVNGDVGGWRTYDRDERGKLIEYALMAVGKGSYLLEIGTAGGLSTSVLVEVAKSRQSVLYCCDPIQPDFIHGDMERVHRVRTEMLDSLKKVLPGYPYTIFRQATSRQFHPFCWGVEFDFIHIDGDHSYKAVKQDCQLWLPQLNVGGIVVFHDYHLDCMHVFGGLVQAVDEETAGKEWETLEVVQSRHRMMIKRRVS